MLPEAVIDRQVTRQPAVPLVGVLEGHGVGPFPAQGLDKSLGLAVGAGRVGPGSDMAQSQGAASLGKGIGDIGGAVVAHHPAALDPLAVEPGKRPGEEADHGWFLLVLQYLDVRQPRGVVDGDMDLVVADAVGAPFLAITGDSVPHFPEASQGFDVDVEQIARPLPLVALHWRFGLQVSQPTQSDSVESTGHGRKRSRQQPGDVPEMQALVAEIHGLLLLLRIERSPLGAARAASIRQRGHAA